jgi:hypothetical protein
MGSHEHQPVDVDPQALEHARGMWAGFTTMTKYGVIAVIAVLILMAVFLL